MRGVSRTGLARLGGLAPSRRQALGRIGGCSLLAAGVGSATARSALLACTTLATLATLGASKAQAAGPPQRIVCVGGALTEMVYALGAQDLLVGVDTTSLHPEVARKLPSVGYARALSAEGVLSLAPTQVVATEDAGPPAVMRQIVAAGIPVTVLAANHRFEGMLDRLARVGEIAARPAQAAQLSQHLREDWMRTQAQVASRGAELGARRKGQPLRVLFVLSHSMSQVMVAGSETSAQAVIEYAGGVNALQGFSGFKPMTPEAALAAQPDVILGTEQGLKAAGGVAGLLRLPGLGDTPAGQSRRVVALEAVLLLGFGPRLPGAVRDLNTALAAAMQA